MGGVHLIFFIEMTGLYHKYIFHGQKRGEGNINGRINGSIYYLEAYSFFMSNFAAWENKLEHIAPKSREHIGCYIVMYL